MLELVLALLVTCVPLPAPPAADPLGLGFFGIQPATSDSLVIESVSPNTAAERAGLRRGDLIQRVGKLRPVVFNEVRLYVMEFRPGTEFEVEVKRAGEPVKLTIRLMIRPATMDREGRPIEP